MLNITPIPALNDNYFWLISRSDSSLAYVVDPGDGQIVQQVLQEKQLQLAAIFVTHRHYDHVDGIPFLLQHYQTALQIIPVYGPDSTAIPLVTHPVSNNERISLYDKSHHLTVIATPGHTTEHISYFSNDMQDTPTLFCGDTLFAAGCGRISGGTATQLYNSLSTLAKLPNDTQVYCAHEYTLANLAFAKTVEPNNTHITHRITRETDTRKHNKPTIPTTMLLEKQTNPFLRTAEDTIKNAVEHHWSTTYTTENSVFTDLRRWKDNF